MIGTRLAHYEITAHLGSGGMGEVYQATDVKLGRGVAIKVLPAAFVSDLERLSRFRREAQLLASLNHSNIAQIYGLEESGGTQCIVMELIEGETLQAVLRRGPIPVDDALAIAKQIVDALDAAHEKGIVHRDLKPGNVMLSKDGSVKVLDFGLAKAAESKGSDSTLSNSPTIGGMVTSAAATVQGMILGTETDRYEVYVRRYPDGPSLPVSTTGGNGPAWRPDGRELYFQGAVGGVPKMMAVSVTPDGASLRLGTPAPLFDLRTTRPTGEIEQYVSSGNFGANYDVLADGVFVMHRGADPSGARELIVVQNWFEDVKRLAPVK